MPARSKAQQKLFGMALAVRKGELERSKVSKEVLDIVDGEMTNKEIEDFASTSHKGLADHIKEAIDESMIARTSAKKVPHAFIVIKPGFLGCKQDIVKMFTDEGFRVIGEHYMCLTLGEAHRLYKQHAKEDFYDELCKYMSSSTSVGILLLPTDEKHYYDLYKVIDMLKDQVRKKYGKDDMRNAIHGSDSEEAMKRESKIYF